MSAPPRILFIASDTIGPSMAGSGIRAWNLARVIGAQQPVTLATINDVSFTAPPGVTLHSYAAPDESARGHTLAGLIASHDVIIAQHIPYIYTDPEVLRERLLIVDLYAPWILEKLEYARIDAEIGEPGRRDDVAILNRLLSLGDAFICASERQRDFWLGALAAANRLETAGAKNDPSLRNLIDVVPFGLPAEPPARNGPGPREQFATVGEEAKLILWNGGLWNWLDPFTAIEAMALVAEREPRARLIFMGVRSPSEVVARMRVVDDARALAERLGLLDRVVIFNDWVPYEERQNWLLEADLGLSLHHSSLEARFAYRTRMLDNLWCSLPVVATEGDILADLIEHEQIGRTAPPGDANAVAEAIMQALDADNQSTFRENLKRIAPDHSWEAVALPLLRWCAQPVRSESPHAADPRDEYIHRLERTYSETADYSRHLERAIADKDRQLAAQELTLRNLIGAAKRRLRHFLPG
ncbi:MAG TPA: glycosyltransferase family 4 protein [Nitrolancea sp.]